MSYSIYEIVSQTSVKGMPLQVRTVETATTRDEAVEAHAMGIAIAHPHSRGGRGIVIRIQERPDLRSWAQDKVKEAMDRARQDSKPRKISMTFEQHSDWDKCPFCAHGQKVCGVCGRGL